MGKKYWIFVVAVAGIVSGVLGGWHYTSAHAAAPAASAYSCVAGANEQCASDLWMADYRQLKAIQARYQAPHDVQITIQGLASTLQASIPQGYTWDEKKERFVKLPPPLAAQGGK